MSDIPSQKAGLVGLTGVELAYCCAHNDLTGAAGVHGHSYLARAWWQSEPRRDKRVLQHMLRTALQAFDHKTVPDELSYDEDMAAALLGLLTDCCGVEVSRPLEGFFAKVGVCG